MTSDRRSLKTCFRSMNPFKQAPKAPLLSPDEIPFLPLPYHPSALQQSDTSQNPQLQSFFFNNPLEVRDQIYDYAFGGDYVGVDFPIVVLCKSEMKAKDMNERRAPYEYYSNRSDQVYHYTEGSLFPRLGTNTFSASALSSKGWMRSCRQAYIEAFPHIYSSNTFKIKSVYLLKQLIRSIHPTYLSHITSLYTSCGNFHDRGPCCTTPIFEHYKNLITLLSPTAFPVLRKLVIVLQLSYHDTNSYLKGLSASSCRQQIFEPADGMIRNYSSRFSASRKMSLRIEMPMEMWQWMREEQEIVVRVRQVVNLAFDPGVAPAFADYMDFWKIAEEKHAEEDDTNDHGLGSGKAGQGLGYWVSCRDHGMQPQHWPRG